jgi:hypothetical protein
VFTGLLGLFDNTKSFDEVAFDTLLLKGLLE